MMAFLKRTTACLLAVVFSLAGFLAGPTSVAAVGTQDLKARRCCGSGCGSCSAMPCCAKPAERHAPITPCSVPQNCSKEIHALLAHVIASVSILPTRPKAFSFDFSPLPRAGAVPIFQRDCSFLI